jgi:hypothetical protein
LVLDMLVSCSISSTTTITTEMSYHTHSVEAAMNAAAVATSTTQTLMGITAAAVHSPQPQLLLLPIGSGPVWSSLTTNPFVVGMAWMITSSIFTTYSTTRFIKYQKPIATSECYNGNTATPPILQRYGNKLMHMNQRIHHMVNPFHKKSNQQPNKEPIIQLVARNQEPSSFTSTTGSQHRYPQQHHSPPSPQLQQLQHQQQQSLSPSSMLTLYRFAGSLLFGLILHRDVVGAFRERLYDTIMAIPTFLLPAICLFIANFTNTYEIIICNISCWCYLRKEELIETTSLYGSYNTANT